MDNLKAKKSSSCKVVKLRRRLQKNEIVSKHHDFSLENSGDIRRFLTPEHPPEVHSRNSTSSVYSQNLIGNHNNLQHKPDTSLIRKLTRRPTISFMFRNQYTRQITSLKEDSKYKFDSILKKINLQIEQSKLEEKIQFSSLPINDRKTYKKQTCSLDFITSSDPLAENSTRKLDKICQADRRGNNSRNSGVGAQANWCMTLRESNENPNIESYLRVGSEINGIYSKVCIPNPTFKKAEKKKAREKKLAIVGRNKLNLEIDAVKKIGYEYLRPELIRSYNSRDSKVGEGNCMSKRIIETPDSISTSRSYLMSGFE